MAYFQFLAVPAISLDLAQTSSEETLSHSSLNGLRHVLINSMLVYATMAFLDVPCNVLLKGIK